MSVDSGAEGLSASFDEDLTLALIERYGLSQEQVALIREKMSERGLAFIDAASYLKFITADEATAAPEQAHRRTPQDGIIQNALPYQGKSLAGWAAEQRVDRLVSDTRTAANFTSGKCADVAANHGAVREIQLVPCGVNRIDFDSRDNIETGLFESERQATYTGE